MWLTSALASVFLIAFILALAHEVFQGMKPPPPPPLPPPPRVSLPSYAPVTRQPKPKPPAAARPKPQDDPVAEEAKQALVALGFSATAAKAALVGTSGSVQERIRQALQKGR